jgi:hypothetical protein
VGHARRVDDLSRGVRRDLLRVLMSPSNVRADAIRQFHERGDDGMVEVLTELEADDLLRFQVIAELRTIDQQ